MKAGWYESNGPANEVIQIGAFENPEIGADDVLIQIFASGVNPSDVKSRARTRSWLSGTKIIPHSDGAGIIEKVGSNVSSDRVGKRVWLYNGQFERPHGTAAEYIALPASQAVPLSDKLTFNQGACLGIPAMTAHRCLFADGSISGQTILVTGGAGAVGHYAIQLAKWGGAKIITTISGDEKATHAKNAGADHVLNYRTENVIEKINQMTNGNGVDRIVDVAFGTNLPITQAVLKANGTIASYASSNILDPAIPFYALMYKNIRIQLNLVYNMPDAAKKQACADINQAIDEDQLIHPIAAVYPLAELAAAHIAVESAAEIGNVIVEIKKA